MLGGLFMSAAPQSYFNAKAEQSFFDRLANPSSIRFTLTFDLDQIPAMKKVDAYFPATFSYQGENWDAKVKVRGRYRRRVCDFPPLSLKLSKDMLIAAGLKPHNKFKLVTHCSDEFDSSDNVLREHLAYELYHLMTGEGYRTQLVQVTYKNATTGDTAERFGILIEDTDEMAQALGGEECDDCYNIAQDRFAAGALERVSLFQYMIGNSDYSVAIPRNVKLVQQQAGGLYRVVPYDFDFAGLVNTEYAVPNPNYAQTDVKDRVWIWEYSKSQYLDATIEQFLSKENQALALVDQDPNLSNKSRRQVTKYLTDFFTSLKDGTFQLEL
jgi:hypothetical protein